VYSLAVVSFRLKDAFWQKPRLRRLHHVQEEIFRQLQMLMPPEASIHDSFASRVAGSPLLCMDVLERHPYTQFLRLTYRFGASGADELAPDAHIRVYRDARMAEVTAFDAEQGCRRMAHPGYPARPLMQRSWRQNLALDKWLGYLLSQGHSAVTMRPARARIDARQVPEQALREAGSTD